MARVVPHCPGHTGSASKRTYNHTEKRQSEQHSSTSHRDGKVAEVTLENVPDIEKLRKKRTEYYTRPPEHLRDVETAKMLSSMKHRRRTIRSSTSTRNTNTSQRPEGMQPNRPKLDSRGTKRRATLDQVDPRNSDYVYGRPPKTVPGKESVAQSNGQAACWVASAVPLVRSKTLRRSAGHTCNGQMHESRSGMKKSESISHSNPGLRRPGGHRHRGGASRDPHEAVPVKVLHGVTGDNVNKIGTNVIHSAKLLNSPPIFRFVNSRFTHGHNNLQVNADMQEATNLPLHRQTIDHRFEEARQRALFLSPPGSPGAPVQSRIQQWSVLPSPLPLEPSDELQVCSLHRPRVTSLSRCTYPRFLHSCGLG